MDAIGDASKTQDTLPPARCRIVSCWQLADWNAAGPARFRFAFVSLRPQKCTKVVIQLKFPSTLFAGRR